MQICECFENNTKSLKVLESLSCQYFVISFKNKDKYEGSSNTAAQLVMMMMIMMIIDPHITRLARHE